MSKLHSSSLRLKITALFGLLFILSLAKAARVCEVKHNKDVVHSLNRQASDYRSYGSQNLRITAVYSDNFKRLPDYRRIANEYIEPALELWRTALKPKKALIKPIQMRRKCLHDYENFITDAYGKKFFYCIYGCEQAQTCYGVRVPRQYTASCRRLDNNTLVDDNDGGYGAQNTDYLIFVDYRANGCRQSTLAYAVHCQLDKSTDRPEIGMMNFCPHGTVFTEENKKNIRNTAIHETAHALGFNWYLVPYMRDESGNPRTKRDQDNNPNEGRDSKNIYIPSWDTGGDMSHWWLTSEKYVLRKTKVLRTPNLLAVARKHFGCPTLEGVELENNGSPGTAYSHFEKRLYFDDVMVGSQTGQETVSDLTLAFFKDTGWYDTNASVAKPVSWGKNLGCDFATKSCLYYVRRKESLKQNASPWCDRMVKYCPLSKMRCQVVEWSNALPEEDRYVYAQPGIPAGHTAYYGGLDSLMDYCPYEVKCGRRR